MKFTTRQQARDFFEGMRWQLVHTWNESHGNGGQDIFEARSPQEGGSAVLQCVSFDRDGHCTGIFAESGGSFLLASEIMGNDEWEIIDSSVSRCCTAGSIQYREKGRRLRGTRCWDVSVSSVAGHGNRASWIDAGIVE